MAADSRSRQILAYAALALVMLLWSGNMIVGRAVRADIPPFTLALVRWSGAFLILLPFAARHVREDRGRLQRQWKSVLLLGFIGVACFNAIMYSALRYTTASNALLLQAGIPTLVVIFDRLLFGIRSPLRQTAGVFLSTLGVIVIVAKGSSAALASLHLGFGDLLVLCGVLAWALYTSLLKLRPDCHPLSFLLVTFAIAAIAMMPLAATEWRGIIAIDWRPAIFGAFAYVAALPSIVAYALYNAAVAEMGAARAGQGISLMPLFGAFLAAALLGEPLHGFHFTGMVLILLGIAASAIAMRPPGDPVQPRRRPRD
jgi:drug/metabolite transporter (DMT)-like permease